MSTRATAHTLKKVDEVPKFLSVGHLHILHTSPSRWAPQWSSLLLHVLSALFVQFILWLSGSNVFSNDILLTLVGDLSYGCLSKIRPPTTLLRPTGYFLSLGIAGCKSYSWLECDIPRRSALCEALRPAARFEPTSLSPKVIGIHPGANSDSTTSMWLAHIGSQC